MISILILTWNEEQNLPSCLKSVTWSDDVVVFDSFSTDRTVEIARAAGVRVETHTFEDYAAQRNAGLQVGFKNPWVLMLDADEQVTDELRGEMLAVTTANDPAICLYRMRRKDMFFGRWMRRSSGYPTWFGRLVRPDLVKVERAINEKVIPDGNVGFLSEHLVHYPFNKGMSHWYNRQNQYSTMEAALTVCGEARHIPLDWLFSHDLIDRRRVHKRLIADFSFRALLIFCYLYVIRLGFLEGFAGLMYCRLRYEYEWLIDVKIDEMRWRECHPLR